MSQFTVVGLFSARGKNIVKQVYCFKDYKRYIQFHIIFWICSTQKDQIHNGANPTCCLSYADNTMSADKLATLGARASAGMVQQYIDPTKPVSSIRIINLLRPSDAYKRQ